MPGYYTHPRSGGSGFVFGDEANRTSESLAADTEITPLDPTKGTLVTVRISGTYSAGNVALGSWNNTVPTETRKASGERTPLHDGAVAAGRDVLLQRPHSCCRAMGTARQLMRTLAEKEASA